MSQARDLADLGSSAEAGTVTGSNVIINGDMTIAQRSTSASASDGSYVSLDRFLTSVSGGGAYTLSQETDVPSGQGFKNSMKVTVDTADTSIATTDYYVVQYRIEGQDIPHFMLGTSNAIKVTLSFWVKSSLTGNFGGSLENNAVNRSYPFQYNISTANTWEKITKTFQLDTSGTWLTTNGTGLKIMLDFGSGTTYQGTADAWASANYHTASSSVQLIGTASATWYMTGLKLEAGTTATDFKHESYAENLAKCQRYFETNYPEGKYPADVIGDIVGAGLTYRTGVATTYQNWPFKVRKRANPTMVAYNGLDGGTGDWRGSGSTDFSVTLYDNEEYFSAGIVATDTAIRSAFYTADAEL